MSGRKAGSGEKDALTPCPSPEGEGRKTPPPRNGRGEMVLAQIENAPTGIVPNVQGSSSVDFVKTRSCPRWACPSGAPVWPLHASRQSVFAVFPSCPPPAYGRGRTRGENGEMGGRGGLSSGQTGAPLGQAQWGQDQIDRHRSTGAGPAGAGLNRQISLRRRWPAGPAVAFTGWEKQ